MALDSNIGSITVTSTGAPAWFTSMSDSVWTAIAGSSGERMSDVFPSPAVVMTGGSYSNNPLYIPAAWCGGFADQSRREYGMCCNGGHADYAGNETYVISLGAETPKWRRLVDPTPSGSLGNPVSDEGNSRYTDGRPRSSHNTFQVHGDGKVWMPALNSVASPGGGFGSIACSLNREDAALLAADGSRATGGSGSPLAWANNLGPWAIHTLPVGVDGTGARFGRGVFDRNNHYVYGFSGLSANSPQAWRFNTTGTPTGQFSGAGGSFGNFCSWAVHAHDLGIIVLSDALRQWIVVVDPSKWGQAGFYTQITNVTGTGFHSTSEFGGAGGVYYEPSNQIIVGDPKNLGRTLYVLTIPTSGGAYNPSGQWVWTSLTPSGSTPTVVSGANNDTYGKLQIIEDMGDGRSCLVFCGNTQDATYVLKIPASGFPTQSTGLEFPSNLASANVSASVRFKFTGSALPPIYGTSGAGLTYLWKYKPTQQTGYYTTFFWANDDGQGNLNTFLWKSGSADSYYGMHPYPPGGSSGTSHNWEISIEQIDVQNGAVTKGIWHKQGTRVAGAINAAKTHEFYFNLPATDASNRVFHTSPSTWANTTPPSPALTFGDAPWQPSIERLSGVLRGIQIYNGYLTTAQMSALSDLETDAQVLSYCSTNGITSLWYLNMNPTPSDISDKSGNAHNPAWVNANRPTLWTG